MEFSEVGFRLTRNKIVEQYIPLLHKVAYGLLHRLSSSVNLDDLMGAGSLGLIDAAGNYNPDRAESFSIYAEIKIRGAMIDSLRANVFVPRSVQRRIKAIENAKRELAQEYIAAGKDLIDIGPLDIVKKVKDVHPKMGINVGQVDEVVTSFISFSDIVVSGSPNYSQNFLDTYNTSRLESKEYQDMLDVLEEALQRLPERQRVVVGLYRIEQLSLKEIGLLFEVSESRISQIKTKGERTLRELVLEIMND